MTDRGGRKSGENLRYISLEILLKWEKEGVNSDALLTEVLDNFSYLAKEKRSFVKRLTEGVIENAILLDHIINERSKVKANKLKPVVRGILRQGVYQLMFMDAIPPHAAINESVKLARLKHLGRLGDYINAVLRSVDRERINVDSIHDISIRYSCPRWITELLKRDYGEEKAEKIVSSFLGAKKLCIRVNETRTDKEKLMARLKEEGLTVKEVEGFEEALEIEGVDMLKKIKSFQEGLFSVQDLSSMSIGRLVEKREGLKVLDLCAAPGGKSCHAAERLKGLGTVEARDVSERKLELIRENAERLGLDNLSVRLMDATRTDEDSIEKYDLVIADLPCSGLGVIGRKNEIKYRLKREDIDSLAELQQRILKVGGSYLKKGGKLIYSVCTITEEETVGNRDYIKELGFALAEEKLFLPLEAADPDGFYYAVFIRNDD